MHLKRDLQTYLCLMVLMICILAARWNTVQPWPQPALSTEEQQREMHAGQ